DHEHDISNAPPAATVYTVSNFNSLLVPNELVVEIDAFETDDPALRGAMTITITLSDDAGATRIDAVHDGLPPGVPAADNETGWRMALAKLAALVETG
ncbi:SRPBCC domain-containing protein, partial [Burkholderia ubonensis]|uniref:SRPBCC domain-containing protein n=1 Tax=Burkholderia ubonensis TaxID=101571 RepID=UPI000B11D8A2